jgi:hypothetical protein
MNKINKPSILLDADVVRHFLTGNKLLFLPKIFPKRFVMLDKVKEELCRTKSIKIQVENFLKMTGITLEDFPKDIQIIKEYAVLKRSFGDGESACMAVAKFQKKYIASSNLSDIKKYCEQNNIVYFTTLDILLEAYHHKIMTLEECDLFIYNLKMAKHKIPHSINSLEDLPNFKKIP